MNQEQNLPILHLITGNEGKFRVSESITNEFENAILTDNTIQPAKIYSYFISRLSFRFWNIFLVHGFLQHSFTVLFRLFNSEKRDAMIALMGPRFQKSLPHFFRKGFKAVYMFDAWPSYHKYIVRFVHDFHVNFLFVSSKQSAKLLNKLIGKNNVFWVPEGVDPKEYKFYPFKEKDIELLSFGRNYQLFHEKIADQLIKRNIKYKFPVEGKMIFPDRQSFIDGLARTKISVCFPTNITHSERAGEIETMTNRYLQSMASKCLILGKAPDEMKLLFGYNPVVEVDMDNPVDQIIEILENFGNYTQLIEKNYLAVINNHSWTKRWESIKYVISENNIQKNKVK